MALTFGFTVEEMIMEGKVTQDQIDDIRQWLHTTNLPKVYDEQIVQFLMACNNVIKDTQITILAYFKYKNLSPEMFSKRFLDSDEMKHIVTVVESCVVPKRTKNNCVIICERLKNTTYWNFHLESALKYLFMTFDLAMSKKPPAGLIVCFDMKDIGLMFLTRLKIGAIRKFFHFVQEGLPCQLVAIHVFNTVYFIDKLMSLLKPFMKKELYDMLNFHPSNMNMEDFFEKHVEAECMPEDYGGKLSSFETLDKRSLEQLKDLQKYWDTEERQRIHYLPPK